MGDSGWPIDWGALRSGARAMAADREARSLLRPLEPTLLAFTTEAAMTLSRFDAEFGARDDALAAVLRRLEAIGTVRLDGRTASAGAVADTELAPPGEGDAVAAEALAVDRALASLLDRADPTSVDAITSFHLAIRHAVPSRARPRPRPGASGPSAMSATRHRPDDAVADRARERSDLDDIAALAHRLDLAALPLVAIVHADLAARAPFAEASGLVARALGQAVLRSRAVTRTLVVPVSIGLMGTGDAYAAALSSARAGDGAPVVGLVSQAAIRACSIARALAADLGAVRGGWHARLTARRDSHAWRLLDALPARPVLDAASAAALLGISANNVYPALHALTEARILTAAPSRRGTIYRSPEVLDLVEATLARSTPRVGPNSASATG